MVNYTAFLALRGLTRIVYVKKAKNKKGRFVMDITEKATMRIERWLNHNEDHLEEYG